MPTLRKMMPTALPKVSWMKSVWRTSRTWLRPKSLLIGLLLVFTAITSGCSSASSPLKEPRKVTVDASLMVKPNLTTEMLSVLSE